MSHGSLTSSVCKVCPGSRSRWARSGRIVRQAVDAAFQPAPDLAQPLHQRIEIAFLVVGSLLGFCDPQRDLVLDRPHVPLGVGRHHLPPRPALVPVLQHRHHRFVADEVRISQRVGAPGRRQASRQRDDRGQSAVEAASRPEVNRICRIAEQESERPRRRRRPRVKLGREARPLHHIQPEPGHRAQVLRRDAEQLQSFLHPRPQARSLEQGRQEQGVMPGAVELAAGPQLQHAGRGLDALGEHPPDRVDPDRFPSLLIGQPHVQEALAVQGVQQEAVLGHGQQDSHGVRQLGLHSQAEHHVLHLRAIERVHRRVAGTELSGEVLQRARAAALADRQYVVSGEVGLGRGWVEAFRNELDMVRPVVRDGEQLIFDVRDPDIARPEILNRIRALGPHLGIGARDKQTLLDFRRKLQELAALDGHDLLAAHITLVRGLPHNPVAIPLPAGVINLDGHARPHQVFQEQGKAEADRPAPGHRDAQGGHGD